VKPFGFTGGASFSRAPQSLTQVSTIKELQMMLSELEGADQESEQETSKKERRAPFLDGPKTGLWRVMILI
jgi:hypothetical protein